MAHYIVIRESHSEDVPFIAEVVRRAYTSKAINIWLNALLNEVTFQAIVLLAAFMFIFMGVPLIYCIFSIPIVLVMMYVLIYGTILLKSAELVHSKRPFQCWVAEAYEPYFSVGESVQNCTYRIIPEEKIVDEGVDVQNCRRTIIGTCAVMRHNYSEDGAWLFRLAVERKYQQKGIGLILTQTVQNWCRNNKFNCIELVITECQEEARQLFSNAGFQVKQLYHKKLFTFVFTMQMCQLRCEVRSTFK